MIGNELAYAVSTSKCIKSRQQTFTNFLSENGFVLPVDVIEVFNAFAYHLEGLGHCSRQSFANYYANAKQYLVCTQNSVRSRNSDVSEEFKLARQSFMRHARRIEREPQRAEPLTYADFARLPEEFRYTALFLVSSGLRDASACEIKASDVSFCQDRAVVSSF